MENYAPPPWRWSSYMIYLEFFCMGDLSPLFICSIIYIVWTHGCLFYNLSYNLVPLSLVTQIVPTFAFGSSFSCLPSSIWHSATSVYVCGYVLTLPYFLALKDIPGSPCVVLAPVLEATISPRSPAFFYWKMVIRNQDLSPTWACCSWGVVSFRPSHLTKERNMYVNKYINIYKCLYV